MGRKRGSSEFQIHLPTGLYETVVFDRLKKHGKNRYSWFGHLKGRPDSRISFAVVSGYFAGALHSEKEVFEFTPQAKNSIRIAELATENFEACDGEEVIMEVSKQAEAPGFDQQNPTNASPTSSRAGITDTFDVMVIYTPQARDGAGGVSAIEATAQAAVDAMNTSFSNSNVDAEATLSYAGLANYNDSGDSSDDLAWVRTDAIVAQLRTAYGADMVSLLVNSTSSCGRGYVMSSPGPGFAAFAYQVTRRSCAVGNLSFAHEFGHNMGLEHNPEDSSTAPENASNPWSYGHYHNNSYRTVMSYSAQCANGCSRRQYYSNPDVQYNGLDTGIEETRDNARTLRQTAAIVADFRPPANDTIFEDGYE